MPLENFLLLAEVFEVSIDRVLEFTWAFFCFFYWLFRRLCRLVRRVCFSLRPFRHSFLFFLLDRGVVELRALVLDVVKQIAKGQLVLHWAEAFGLDSVLFSELVEPFRVPFLKLVHFLFVKWDLLGDGQRLVDVDVLDTILFRIRTLFLRGLHERFNSDHFFLFDLIQSLAVILRLLDLVPGR